MFDCPLDLIPDNFLGFEFVIEIEMPVIQEFWYPAKIFRLVYRVCTITATAPGAKLAHGAVVCSVCCERLQGLATWREGGGSWAGVGSHKVETHKNLNFTRHTVMTAVAADTDWIFRWNITMCYLTNQRCFHWNILTPKNLFQNWNTTKSQKLYLGHII